MGNVASSQPKRQRSSRRQPAQQAWGWEYKNGRMVPKARAASTKKRPLFKKQPTNNYDWWIFNPNAK